MSNRMAPEQQMSDPENLPLAIVQAIAEHEGTDPMDLERPLAEVVDPDALTQLFSGGDDSADAEGYVAFRYEDCGVIVGADGRIEVYDAVELPPLVR